MVSCSGPAKEIIRKEILALESLLDRIGPEFERAVSCLLDTRGKVIATGLGKSGIVASKISATFSSTGTPSIFIHPVEAMHGDLGIIQRGDLGLLLSNSGETPEVLQFLQIFKRFGLKTIGIAGRPGSALARDCESSSMRASSAGLPAQSARQVPPRSPWYWGRAGGCLVSLKVFAGTISVGFTLRGPGRRLRSGIRHLAPGRRAAFAAAAPPCARRCPS